MSQTTNLRNYKATVILDTRGYQDTVDSLIDKLKEAITSVEGKVAEAVNLGQKEFARVTDRKMPHGIYVQYLFEAPASAPAALQEKLRLDRTVKRILVQSA